MKKILLLLTLSLLLFFKTPSTTFAATPSFASSLYLARAVPIYFSWQHSVKLHFIILKNVKSVSYTLTYISDGVPQGATGTFNPMGKNQVIKNILLGTCSSNSCVYNNNPTNIKLDVTFTYKNNHIETKSYTVTP